MTNKQLIAMGVIFVLQCLMFGAVISFPSIGSSVKAVTNKVEVVYKVQQPKEPATEINSLDDLLASEF